MSEEAQNASDARFAAAFVRHSEVAKQAKVEYEKVLQEMLQQLSTTHLQPFADILLQQDNRQLRTAESIDFIRSILHKKLQTAEHGFWDEYNVEYGITSLEMLKEQYANNKDVDWSIYKRTPEERKRNVRVRLLQAQTNNLQRQVQYQQQQLDLAMAENAKFRDSIYKIKLQREQICAAMTQTALNLNENKAKMRKMICALLDTDDSDDDEHTDEQKQLDADKLQAKTSKEQTAVVETKPNEDSSGLDETTSDCIVIDDDDDD